MSQNQLLYESISIIMRIKKWFGAITF